MIFHKHQINHNLIFFLSIKLQLQYHIILLVQKLFYYQMNFQNLKNQIKQNQYFILIKAQLKVLLQTNVHHDYVNKLQQDFYIKIISNFFKNVLRFN